MVRIREVKISINGKDETALAVYTHSLENDADGCRVGFLRKHLIEHKEHYINKCAQVSRIFNEDSECPSDRMKHYRNHGCCRAVLLHEVRLEAVSPLKMESPNGEYLKYLIDLADDTPDDKKKRAVPVPILGKGGEEEGDKEGETRAVLIVINFSSKMRVVKRSSTSFSVDFLPVLLSLLHLYQHFLMIGMF